MSLLSRDPQLFMPSPIHPSCWKNLSHSMESGFAMFVPPILVGGLRDISGSFIPGLAIAAAASWALWLAGILLPLNVTHSPAHIPQAPSQLV